MGGLTRVRAGLVRYASVCRNPRYLRTVQYVPVSISLYARGCLLVKIAQCAIHSQRSKLVKTDARDEVFEGATSSSRAHSEALALNRARVLRVAPTKTSFAGTHTRFAMMLTRFLLVLLSYSFCATAVETPPGECGR